MNSSCNPYASRPSAGSLKPESSHPRDTSLTGRAYDAHWKAVDVHPFPSNGPIAEGQRFPQLIFDRLDDFANNQLPDDEHLATEITVHVQNGYGLVQALRNWIIHHENLRMRYFGHYVDNSELEAQ